MIGIRKKYFKIEGVRNCMNNRRRKGTEKAKEQAGVTGSGNELEGDKGPLEEHASGEGQSEPLTANEASTDHENANVTEPETTQEITPLKELQASQQEHTSNNTTENPI